MLIKKYMLLYTILVCGFFSTPAFSQNLKTLKHIEWLEGQWEMETKKGIIIETWKIVDENKLEGKSTKIFRKDTTLLEETQIVMEGSDIFYVAKVKGQNNNEPVRFKMTDGNRRNLVFENNEHDYPTKVVYKWKQNDRIEAVIGGKIKGKYKEQVFSYKKTK